VERLSGQNAWRAAGQSDKNFQGSDDSKAISRADFFSVSWINLLELPIEAVQSLILSLFFQPGPQAVITPRSGKKPFHQAR